LADAFLSFPLLNLGCTRNMLAQLQQTVPLLGQASLPITKMDIAYQYHKTVSKTLPQGARYTFGGY